MFSLRRPLLCLALLLSAVCGSRAQTWSNLTHGLGTNLTELNSVAFGNGVFVAIKSSLAGSTLHYATSADGATWTARSVATSIASSGGAHRVRFLNGRFLVMPVGINASGAGVALALTSTDGVTWTSATVGTTTTSPDELDFGGGRVLGGGSNGYFIGSTDFTTWSGQSTSLAGAFGIQDVAFGNGRWLVTTNGAGEVATSTDGTNFTKVNNLTAPGGFRVEYGNSTWFLYSQANNAVSSDGVNFTTVTRGSTTPGGTATIRFVNDRFLAYGAAAFQSTTDGQTWTDFGATPSLGSGFVYAAIYDIAYGNGKYVAVGGRDFPSTAALIYTSSGSTGGGSGNEVSLTVAYQVGVTTLPGTTAASTGSLQGYALHNGGVVVAAQNPTGATATLMQHKSGALTALRAPTAGMPGGGTVRFYEIASDGTTAFLTPRSTSVNSAWNGALLKVSGGTVTAEIENSATVVPPGVTLTSDFQGPSAANGAVAFIGRRGSSGTQVLLRQNSATTTVANVDTTAQPNGTGDGKFRTFYAVKLGGDGRVVFDGFNAGSFASPDFRRGLYAWQNGTISVVADNQTTLPGATGKFYWDSSGIPFVLSPDGTRILVHGSNNDYAGDTTERHGIYVYASGTLTRVADNTTVVDGKPLRTVMTPMAVMNDGTVFFYASPDDGTHVFRARNGTIERFIEGSASGTVRSPTDLWIHQGQVFVHGYDSTIKKGLFRKPVEGGDVTQILNVGTHTMLKAMNASAFEDLQFAGDLALLRIGANVGGIERSGILYGAASAFLGSSSGPTTPQSQAASAGGSVTLTTAATGTVQWQRNGASVANGTGSSLSLTNVQPTDAGIYSAVVTNGGTTTQSAIVGVSTSAKAIGSGNELAANITHANGNIFDQVQLTGAAATITADANQITRLSFVDLQDDIVQVELSGAGSVSIVLDAPTGPATPVNYNQPTVSYMKGHAGIVVTGANETTNLSVFSVGRANAVNQALFKDSVTYDGMADIAFVAIHSTNGKFGGLRTANGSYFATRGFTGVYAPGVEFTGPVFVGDINAADNATPVFMIGSSSDTRVTGGDLAQTNARAVQVAGLTQLRFTANANSHGVAQTAKANQARLERDGTDVTSQIVVNP